MRRKDREVTNFNDMEEIIRKCRVCRLGLMDREFPYVVALNFGYVRTADRFTLYFHCANEGKKLELIQNNPHAAFEMDCSQELVTAGDNACQYSYRFESIQGRGMVEIVQDAAEKQQAILKLMEQMTQRTDFELPEKALDMVTVLKLEVSELSGKRHL